MDDNFFGLFGALGQSASMRQQQQQQQYQQNLFELQIHQQRNMTGGLQGLFQSMLGPQLAAAWFRGMTYGPLPEQYPEHWKDDPDWQEYMLECRRELGKWDEALGIDQTGR